MESANSTNATEEVIVRGFFSSDPASHLLVNLVNFQLSVAVIFISLRIPKDDLCRLYTLWLFSVYAPHSLLQSLIAFLQLKGVVDSSGNFYYSRPNVLLIIGKVFDGIAGQVYRILAFLMVFLTFASYRYPFVYQQHFTPKRRSALFMVGFVFVIALGIIGNVFSFYNIDEGSTVHVISAICYYSVQLFVIGSAILMAVFYFLSIHTILLYARKKLKLGQSSSPQRRQIVSVLAYCTFPNIVSLPVVFINVCYVYISLQGDISPSHGIFRIVAFANPIIYYCNIIRLPLITVSTFVAFAPYRKYVLRKPSTTPRVFSQVNASRVSVVSNVPMPRIESTALKSLFTGLLGMLYIMRFSFV